MWKQTFGMVGQRDLMLSLAATRDSQSGAHEICQIETGEYKSSPLTCG